MVWVKFAQNYLHILRLAINKATEIYPYLLCCHLYCYAQLILLSNVYNIVQEDYDHEYEYIF